LSSKKDEKSGRIIPHKHCPVCGAAIPMDKEYCSSECAEADMKQKKQLDRMRKLVYLMIAVMIALTILMMSLGR
jgi:predicted nucleic acid-binding Zn ribbon protein